MAEPALQFEVPTIRRFLLPDLSAKGIWLVKRLQERWPSVQDGDLINMLRGIILGSSSAQWFVRTDHAVALAHILHEPPHPLPAVAESFVLLDGEQFVEEGVELYREMKGWAKSLNAHELRIGFHTDVPIADIKRAVGKVYAIDRLFTTL